MLIITLLSDPFGNCMSHVCYLDRSGGKVGKVPLKGDAFRRTAIIDGPNQNHSQTPKEPHVTLMYNFLFKIDRSAFPHPQEMHGLCWTTSFAIVIGEQYIRIQRLSMININLLLAHFRISNVVYPGGRYRITTDSWDITKRVFLRGSSSTRRVLHTTEDYINFPGYAIGRSWDYFRLRNHNVWFNNSYTGDNWDSPIKDGYFKEYRTSTNTVIFGRCSKCNGLEQKWKSFLSVKEKLLNMFNLIECAQINWGRSWVLATSGVQLYSVQKNHPSARFNPISITINPGTHCNTILLL